ncbi:hypothetical protein DW718_02945 [Weissella cibaria]|uniref:hypothetical protein n=1 Tax=Weissella cibaria TaxID=137591 RepID=UPI000E4F3939|nr:hypothetical protein [Weissella cibaria]RHE74198.1 hypothetical protein DW718_02945 [Weissella cibaria]RHE76328.1 hypothetical protein DW717_09425 [Weissella cibaria]
MTKYVIDLPEGMKFIVGKGYVMLSEKELLRIPVENLQEYIAPTVAENAPVEKRVIELPADSIAWLERMKSNLETVDVYDLFNNVLTDTSGSYVSYQLNFNSETAALNTVAEWVLGHVEFVPKNEPRFVVEVDRHEYIYASFIGSAIGKKTVDFWKIPQEVTEEEADELVAGLTALNARKVEVDE